MADRICNRIGDYESMEMSGWGEGTVKNDGKELSQSTTEQR
jgi:hypothetical protein